MQVKIKQGNEATTHCVPLTLCWNEFVKNGVSCKISSVILKGPGLKQEN